MGLCSCGNERAEGSCARCANHTPEGFGMGITASAKGQTSIKLFNNLHKLKRRLYWRNHFGAKG